MKDTKGTWRSLHQDYPAYLKPVDARTKTDHIKIFFGIIKGRIHHYIMRIKRHLKPEYLVIKDTDITGWIRAFRHDESWNLIKGNDNEVYFKANEGLLFYPFDSMRMFTIDKGDFVLIQRVDDSNNTWRQDYPIW